MIWSGQLRRFIVLSILIVVILGAFQIHTTGAAEDISVSMTIVPANIVTSASKVEMRAGFINRSAASVNITLEFMADSKTVKSEVVSLGSNSSKYVSFWWDPADSTGCKVLGIRALINSKIVAEEYRIITVIKAQTKSPGILTIAWEEPGAYKDGTYLALRAKTRQDVFSQVSDMHRLGIDTIIFTYPEFILYNTGAYYDSDLPDLLNVTNPHPLAYDLLDTMLLAAEELGMNVIIGTGRGKDLFIPTITTEFNKAVDLAVSVMDEIWNKYGHYKSFYGWYMTHEPSYLFSTGNGDLKFFNAIIDRVRMKWPDKIVMCAPTGTPQIKTDDMKNSQIDIFAFQDAVGPGYIPGQYTYDPENRIAMLDDVFSSYRSSMNKVGKHMWSDLETWEMAGPTYADAYPALWSRVIRQINIEKNYSDALSMYAYTGFLSSPESTVQIGGEKAVDLFEEYAAYADAYMDDQGIHEHTITTLSVELTVTDISKAAELVPEMITVRTNCGKDLKVKADWTLKSSGTTEAELNGRIVLPGIRTATVTGVVRLGSSNSQVIIISEPSSSDPASSAFSSSAISSSSTQPVNSSSQTSAGSDAFSSEQTASTNSEDEPSGGSSSANGSESLSILENSTVSDDISKNVSSEITNNNTGGAKNGNIWTWLLIMIPVLMLAAASPVIIVKRRKKLGGTEL